MVNSRSTASGAKRMRLANSALLMPAWRIARYTSALAATSEASRTIGRRGGGASHPRMSRVIKDVIMREIPTQRGAGRDLCFPEGLSPGGTEIIRRLIAGPATLRLSTELPYLRLGLRLGPTSLKSKMAMSGNNSEEVADQSRFSNLYNRYKTANGHFIAVI